jgi:hypothetical protein
MKFTIAGSVKLMAISTLLMAGASAALLIIWVKPVPAEVVYKSVYKAEPTCAGESCDNRNPVEAGCDRDAIITEEITATFSQLGEGSREMVIQKLFSQRCRTAWAKAYVPNNTFVFIREQGAANAIQGMIQADGTDYFWAHSKMSYGSAASQACVAVPVFANGDAHNLYDRHCTDFSRSEPGS